MHRSYWGSFEKLQWMWLNCVRTCLGAERSFNVSQGKGCVLPTCQSMSKKTLVSFERLFPHPSCLPSHVAQLLSTAYILHKTYVLGQLSKKTEPIYCPLNLLSVWPCTYLQLTLHYMSREFSILGRFFKQCICYKDNASPSGKRKTILLQWHVFVIWDDLFPFRA